MIKQVASLAVGVLALGAGGSQAATVYLNHLNTTVSLGASMPAEPFVDHTTAHGLSNILNAPTADAGENHAAGASGTHIWYSNTLLPLELDFTFDDEYDLTHLHFWNYYTETYDVDEMNFTFYDAAFSEVGTLQFFPDIGTSSPQTAQTYALSFPSRVQHVNLLMSGTNGQVDFANIGFTGQVSPPLSTVPLPASGLLLIGALGMIACRRRRTSALVDCHDQSDVPTHCTRQGLQGRLCQTLERSQNSCRSRA